MIKKELISKYMQEFRRQTNIFKCLWLSSAVGNERMANYLWKAYKTKHEKEKWILFHLSGLYDIQFDLFEEFDKSNVDLILR